MLDGTQGRGVQAVVGMCDADARGYALCVHAQSDGSPVQECAANQWTSKTWRLTSPSSGSRHQELPILSATSWQSE